MEIYINASQLAHNIMLGLINKEDKTKDEILLYNQSLVTLQTFFRLTDLGMKDLIQRMEDTDNVNSGPAP